MLKYDEAVIDCDDSVLQDRVDHVNGMISEVEEDSNNGHEAQGESVRRPQRLLDSPLSPVKYKYRKPY
jgi:hypothetical protein